MPTIGQFCLIATLCCSFNVTCADESAAKPPLRLRVLSYNIHHGEGTDGKFDLERIAKVIKSTEADVVALQEVDVKTKRASGVDQGAELGRLTGMHHAFGKAINYSGGDYGQAILSKWKPAKFETHKLPGSHEGEQRIAVAADLRIGDSGPAIRFIGTHLDHRPNNGDRLAQAAKLNELFATDAAQDPATVLVGDLNAEPGAEEINLLLGKWSSAAAAPGMKAEPTFPSGKPTVQIDYILLRPAKRWKVIEVKVIDEKIASDHRPLLAVLEWAEK